MPLLYILYNTTCVLISTLRHNNFRGRFSDTTRAKCDPSVIMSSRGQASLHSPPNIFLPAWIPVVWPIKHRLHLLQNLLQNLLLKLCYPHLKHLPREFRR